MEIGKQVADGIMAKEESKQDDADPQVVDKQTCWQGLLNSPIARFCNGVAGSRPAMFFYALIAVSPVVDLLSDILTAATFAYAGHPWWTATTLLIFYLSGRCTVIFWALCPVPSAWNVVCLYIPGCWKLRRHYDVAPFVHEEGEHFPSPPTHRPTELKGPARMHGVNLPSPPITPDPAAVAAVASSQTCYQCDGCDDFPLQHVRHHCLVCADFDLCSQCYDVFHGPNSQFQGSNAVMLRDHSTSHETEALPVNPIQPEGRRSSPVAPGLPPAAPHNSSPPSSCGNPAIVDQAAPPAAGNTSAGERKNGVEEGEEEEGEGVGGKHKGGEGSDEDDGGDEEELDEYEYEEGPRTIVLQAGQINPQAFALERQLELKLHKMRYNYFSVRVISILKVNDKYMPGKCLRQFQQFLPGKRLTILAQEIVLIPFAFFAIIPIGISAFTLSSIYLRKALGWAEDYDGLQNIADPARAADIPKKVQTFSMIVPIVEALLESAPQLALQLRTRFYGEQKLEDWVFLTTFSVSVFCIVKATLTFLLNRDEISIFFATFGEDGGKMSGNIHDAVVDELERMGF